MTKKATKAKADKNKGGRPTGYKAEYAEQARKLSLLGLTDAQLADVFGCAESTLNLWKLKQPEFSEAIKEGKGLADAKVAESLFHRACGYSHPEDKIMQHDGAPLIVPTTKHYPPDPTAAIFWLKNRQKEQWRDKIDHEHTGKNGGAIDIVATILGGIDGDTAGIPSDKK